ncbi:MAG: pyridoxal-dependent decarboxylase [Terracidiphilus sp.]|jgi:glutamate/tyrosine decarboxylase-like PLP-dependent enzyme
MKDSPLGSNLGHPPRLPDESSLDPSDWQAFRQLAHEALDEAIRFLETVRDRPVWQKVPDEVRAHLSAPLPREGTPLPLAYREFTENIMPYATGNIHPRFFGWVHGSGQAGNIVAELLGAAMNSNCGGRDHGAIYVEREVINWFKELFGFPRESAGLIVSGTSMANLIAIGVARNSISENMRKEGVQGLPRSLAAYASAEVHDSVVKALEILGIGSSSLRRILVNPDYTVNVNALKEAIASDRAAGYQPFCVIGSAGTVNTGAIDDLNQLASLCANEKLWFHVDGAFGALCMMSERLRPRLKGIERADSLGFDFHKWAHVQYDAGCILVRNGAAYRAAYSMRPAYLQHADRGLGAGEDWPCDYGPELSRSFRALKIWFALKEHGTSRIGELIDQNCAQAEYLAHRIESEPQLELLAPVSLNIVCFRLRRDGLDAAALDKLNKDIVADVQESGVAAPSTTRIKGQLAIRVNITNHRTQRPDLDALVDAVLKAGRMR